MKTIDSIAREEDRNAQRQMWRRLNRRDALPRWFVGLLACLGVVALACVSTFWLINGIGNGVVR